MGRLDALANRLRRYWHGLALEVWYDPRYRLPLPTLEARTGFEPRRADFAAWYLLEQGAIANTALRRPRKASYEELARVHTPEFLDALARPEELAHIFSADVGDVRVDEVLGSVRLAAGATVDAARSVLRPGGARLGRRALNLAGGFHHASPSRAGGFCPVNDLAVAVKAVRADGFDGQVVVLDLDAHPPDGTADCLRDDARVWIGSLSGSSWGPLPGVDETLLPHASDAQYLDALDALLRRMPRDAALAFVVAGGDVLAHDHLGQLSLSLEGARARDLRVADALLHVPSVWVPAGGYGPDAWRVLAGTGLALGLASRTPVPETYDPLEARFHSIARTLRLEHLGTADDLSLDDVASDLGLQPASRRLLLGFYTREGIEHALHRYGVLAQLVRLGYGPFHVEFELGGVGEGVRVYGRDEQGGDHLLIEALLEKKRVDNADVLYVHWLTLRNPRARFSETRPRLPGQEVPGLGLAREVAELLMRMAHRLRLAGLVYRPASYHVAYAGRHVLRFIDPQRQGRFEALVRDTAALPLLDVSKAVADGRLKLNGVPYKWEPDEMARWIEEHAVDESAVSEARAAAHFTIEAPGDPGTPYGS